MMSRIEHIFARLAAEQPKPETELNFHSAFELLVAVVLSAQATDVAVNKVTEKLFVLANEPSSMLALGEDQVIACIRSIGLFRNKARHIMGLCEVLLRDFQGQVPDSREALMRLPGVGRKTANVVLNVWFAQPTMAVDTHIFRLSHRLALSRGHTPEQVEEDLLAVVPEPYLQHAHHWLILHGRYVCKARKPLCTQCLLREYCPSLV